MSWNAGRFCSGMEGFLGAAISTAFNSARDARTYDRTGPAAITRLARALRQERRRSQDLERELIAAYQRIRQDEQTISLLRQARR